MKQNIRHIIKKFRRKHTDYTLFIYLLRVSGFILTWVYSLSVLFDIKKRIEFDSKNNPLLNRYTHERDVVDNKLNLDFDKLYLKGDYYQFNQIKLPVVKDVTTLRLIYEDVLSIYTEKNDDYSFDNVSNLEKNSSEGPFCILDRNNDGVLVEEGDVVIDAGAWVGDFAAYCYYKGATVYAFEPTKSTYTLLQKTIEINNMDSRVSALNYGLGDITGDVEFESLDEGSANVFKSGKNTDNGVNKSKMFRLDDWVKEKGIKKIDFIKADIEGYERNMLKGASWVLKNFKPKLAICTYHLKDDPEVLSKIIKEANIEYKIIQRGMKLYAY